MFAFGYFGADSLVTVLLTAGFRAPLGKAAMVLNAAPLGWALASPLVARSTKDTRRLPVAGLSLTALGTAVLAVESAAGQSFAVALVAWAAAGVGVGLAYPVLYLRATGSSDFSATELATAVITVEAVGGLLARAIGGTVSSHPGGLLASYVLFAVALLAAAGVSCRL